MGTWPDRTAVLSSIDRLHRLLIAETLTATVAASASGSQLASYAAGALTAIWVVGAQKIVSDLDAALRPADAGRRAGR